MENPLPRIMAPSSIAIVGASNNPTKMGSIQCLNLINCGFPGEIIPVHPRETIVLGRKAYPSIKALPAAPDLAVLVVPTGLVPTMLADFGEIGTRFAIIISAGFKETGSQGRALEQEVNAIAARYGIRFLGPNCLGIVNSELPLNMTVLPLGDYHGRLGLASQSGTYVTQTLPYLHRKGIKLSKAISVGNEANIDIVDCLEYLGQDEATKAIGLYIEGIRRAERFLEVAQRISRVKPIVAQYVGGTEAGARSGSSHTGAMAGPDYIYDALFEQAGIIRVGTIEEVYAVGWTLATQPPLKGKRIAVLTNSGGPGTAIANTCNHHGLDVPEFSAAIQAAVAQFLPGHASPRNPVDLTFHVGMQDMTENIPQVLFQAPDIDGVIIHGIMDTGMLKSIYPNLRDFVGMSEDEFLAMGEADLSRLVDMPIQSGKPLLISSFFDRDDHALRVFHDHGIPVFDSPEKTAKAMAALHRQHLIRSRPVQSKAVEEQPPAGARAMLEAAPVLDEFAAKQLLRAYGMPTSREGLAYTLEDALDTAAQIGYPVAVKACSPDIQHKTEQGLVRLDIRNATALKQAFQHIRAAVPAAPVLVAEMLAGEREFMAGINTFPGFPPCVLFGVGGIFTEVFKDFSLCLAPLSPLDAGAMLDRIAANVLLGPYRGLVPVDREALSAILMALGRLALDFPVIKEIDLNPIIVVQGKPVIADALIVKG